MESADTPGETGPEQSGYGTAWEQFGQLLRALLRDLPKGADTSVNTQSLARLLAVELERWLRNPASMPPSWRSGLTPSTFEPGSLPFGLLFQPGIPFATASGPGLLGLGEQNGFAHAGQRVADLLARCSQLQAQLAMHWCAIARLAGERFVARAAKSDAVVDLKTIRRLYDSWVECAERAYAETVHSEDFCRVQAALINTSTALYLEQRRQVESLASLLGLASRSEIEALRLEMRRMQSGTREGSTRRASKRRSPKEGAS